MGFFPTFLIYLCGLGIIAGAMFGGATLLSTIERKAPPPQAAKSAAPPIAPVKRSAKPPEESTPIARVPPSTNVRVERRPRHEEIRRPESTTLLSASRRATDTQINKQPGRFEGHQAWQRSRDASHGN